MVGVVDLAGFLEDLEVGLTFSLSSSPLRLFLGDFLGYGSLRAPVEDPEVRAALGIL